MENLYESQQFTKEKLFELFEKTEKIRNNLKEYEEKLKGKILATLFYEPSTRTRLSFETAMLRLGGQVVSTENARDFSSAIKGESIEDTIRVINSYSDIIVIRHYEEGSARKACEISKKPVINAGDGKGQHPTQSLLDAYTIYKEIGRLENVRITFVGDLLTGRTTRSLCYLLGKFSGNEIVFVSPKNLRMKDDIKEYLNKHKVKWKEETELEKILPTTDILYITRVQKERLTKKEYEKARGKYVINEKNLKLLKKEARIMHPLPHVEEINLSIKTEQNNKKIAYFRQAENGLWIRMALLLELLEKK
jgi:aspartate carbamoyltransferase catalytic subunit